MVTELKATSRDHSSKSMTKKIRHQGQIPAVVYGQKADNTAIAVSENEMTRIFQRVGRNGVLRLDIDGERQYSVMAHDIQKDRLKDEMIHIDFLQVDMDTEMDSVVPVHTTGDSPGEKEGGILQHSLNELNVRAKPADIPSVIEVDISELNIGDTVQISELTVSGNYELLDDPEEPVVTIIPPGRNVEDEDDEGTDGTEVIQDKGEEVQDGEQDNQ
ncbi:50S ribosomal protein L25/general stress protein Ctc [Tuberibacillus sp. Marseille-P3662]|uniref:50S ribosomal protein L25/general stress protein Ctc n=1 Tax=Tuberibacillus sp. Marseille-P3662 TaxID=1965358 RepID=UPI000A1CB333|nr:50S ribosomal protein L25/general stress protein Ctc [Tuberibacillus sp. Marseille-P3662]